MKDLDKLIDLLPHREPMKMLDHVISINETEILVIKKVQLDEPYFKGHFPNQPVFPGVLMIEAMAQAGGLLILHEKSQRFDHVQQSVFYLAQVQEARFIKPVYPDAVLEIKVSLLGHKKGFYQFSGQIFHQGDQVAHARWTCFYKA